jgi:hypothetical protein
MACANSGFENQELKDFIELSEIFKYQSDGMIFDKFKK